MRYVLGAPRPRRGDLVAILLVSTVLIARAGQDLPHGS